MYRVLISLILVVVLLLALAVMPVAGENAQAQATPTPSCGVEIPYTQNCPSGFTCSMYKYCVSGVWRVTQKPVEPQQLTNCPRWIPAPYWQNGWRSDGTLQCDGTKLFFYYPPARVSYPGRR